MSESKHWDTESGYQPKGDGQIVDPTTLKPPKGDCATEPPKNPTVVHINEYKVGYETGYRDALYESKKIAMEIASWLDGQVREHAESNIETLFNELKPRLDSDHKPPKPDTEEYIK